MWRLTSDAINACSYATVTCERGTVQCDDVECSVRTALRSNNNFGNNRLRSGSENNDARHLKVDNWIDSDTLRSITLSADVTYVIGDYDSMNARAPSHLKAAIYRLRTQLKLKMIRA